MALVSTVYPPEIWANESLLVLRDNLVFARLCHRDFENEVAFRGDTVHTRKPTKGTAKTWGGQTGTDAGEQIEVENLNARDLSIILNTLLYSAFIVEDRDASITIKELVAEYMIPFMDPMAQKVDDDLMTEFCTQTDIAGLTVTAVAYDDVGLAAAMNTDDIVTARETLNSQQCPTEGRRLIVSNDHEADLLRTALFVQADQSGSTEALVNAQLGRKFGFDIYMSQNVPDAVDTDATPQSIAFHRNAIALVTRPLVAPPPSSGAMSAYQALDGVAMRVVTAYDQRYMGMVTTFSMLYGVALMDRNLGVIINP